MENEIRENLNGGYIMANKVPFSFIVVIGLMLFALFFWSRKFNFSGNAWSIGREKMCGLLTLDFFSNRCWITITRGVLAFGFSGKDDLQSLASRTHPVFGIVFTTVL